jgi:acylphosphatase
MDESRVRRRAVVSGVVQGVGFRWSARERAQALGVAGYARNLVDGTVEVEAEGSPGAVEDFLAWLSSGPPSASVSGVDVRSVPATGSSAFDVG